MINLHLAPEEQKILAYVCGFVLRILEESDESSSEKQEALRHVLDELIPTEPVIREVSLDKDTASSIAVSMKAACMDFEADFLDWRTFRRNKPDLSISTFRPLVRVWRELFADILKEPGAVVLMFHPYLKAWDTADLKILRGLGTESAPDLRAAILAGHAVTLGTERRLQVRLLTRMEAIAVRRGELIKAVDAQSGECPTCHSELHPGGVCCSRCAEVFPGRLPSDGYQALGALSVQALEPLRMCGLLEGFLPLDEVDEERNCAHPLLGEIPFGNRPACAACGRLRLPYSSLLLDPEALPLDDLPDAARTLPGVRMAAVIRTLSSARSSRIAYNLAIGFPPLRTYGATSLGDPEEVEAANTRKWREAQKNSEEFRKRIQEIAEIHAMAGLDEGS